LRNHARFDDLLLHDLLLDDGLHDWLLKSLLLNHRLLHSAVALTGWSLAMTVGPTRLAMALSFRLLAIATSSKQVEELSRYR
jgi:hypothetical protein